MALPISGRGKWSFVKVKYYSNYISPEILRKLITGTCNSGVPVWSMLIFVSGFDLQGLQGTSSDCSLRTSWPRRVVSLSTCANVSAISFLIGVVAGFMLKISCADGLLDC